MSFLLLPQEMLAYNKCINDPSRVEQLRREMAAMHQSVMELSDALKQGLDMSTAMGWAEITKKQLEMQSRAIAEVVPFDESAFDVLKSNVENEKASRYFSSVLCNSYPIEVLERVYCIAHAVSYHSEELEMDDYAKETALYSLLNLADKGTMWAQEEDLEYGSRYWCFVDVVNNK